MIDQKQDTGKGKIFTNHLSYKRLVSGIYKEQQTLKVKRKRKIQLQNGQKTG